jgi:hypothetical protein
MGAVFFLIKNNSELGGRVKCHLFIKQVLTSSSSWSEDKRPDSIRSFCMPCMVIRTLKLIN